MGSNISENGDTIVGTSIGAIVGIAGYLAAIAVSDRAGISVIPIAFALFGAMGVYAFRSRYAAKRAKLHTNWTNEQQISALSAHTLMILTDEMGLISYVNQMLLDATGWDEEDLIGAPEQKLLADSDVHLNNKVRRVLERGESWKGTNQLRRKDGTEFPTDATIMPRIDSDGKIKGSISIRTQETHSELLESQQNLVAILTRLQDEVYIFDADTLHFNYLNHAALKSVGWSADKITCKSLKDLTPGFDEDQFRIMAQPLLKNEVLQIQRTIVFNARPYDANLQLIRNDEGADQFICVMRDASKRLESEQIKSEFVSTVSHELRSPMTSVKGALGLVLSGSVGELSDKARGLLEIAHRNADRLVLIINDILDLEKMDAGGMPFENEEKNLADLVRESVKSMEPYANRFGVSIATRGLEAPAMAYVDPTRIIQVITNLVSNAVKFSPAGEVVTIELSATEFGLRVEVHDNGKGIPIEKQAQIFERFSQISSEGKSDLRGTGLGLSIVKTIIEKQGGTVGFISREGVGSSFFFQLPSIAFEQAPRISAVG